MPAPYSIGAGAVRAVSGGAVSRRRARQLAKVLGPAFVLAGVTQAPPGRRRRRRARYMVAQFCHESDHFRTTAEYASGAAYEGRRDLGNVHPGDGRRYRGGGFIQVTGRENYRLVTGWVRDDWKRIKRLFPWIKRKRPPDFERHPHLLRSNLTWAAIASALWWRHNGCNGYADRGEFVGLTRRINGGTNGYADRRLALARTVGRGRRLVPKRR